ncbi:MAG: excinuclease ABC subunit UvrC [Bacilli bacterium]|nr:excinuclease ABC subunit UvrC [Bacilli bacterium]
MDLIKKKLSLVPNKPGCYQMKNKDGIIIYVGKAKKLKNRLSSYFRGNHTGKTKKLVSEIVDFEYIVVDSETEALILELNLIKKYDPKYNILLRDDKSYPYIEFKTDGVPKLEVVRNINRKKTKDKLFGPYPNVTAARNTVNLLNRIYPLRKCNTYPKKPCLYYHIGQCLGYCNNVIEEEKINEMKNEILSFLRGNDEIVINKLTKEMHIESGKLNFEKAKELKEMIEYIKYVLQGQKVELKDNIDRDVFGYYVEKGYISIQVFFIRGGKILERVSKIFPMIDDEYDELTRFIVKFYDKNLIKPKEIFIPQILDETILEDVLDLKVVKPLKGVKKALVDLASENAKAQLNQKFELIKKDEEKTVIAQEELRTILNLPILSRIEIFDNAHLFGTYNVSGMVVYIDGVPSKNDYRKYKISVDKNDDYGTMREVIYRRYFKVLVEDLTKPDLIIVDGAKGQINVALDVINSLGLSIPIVGLKKDNKHTTSALIFNNKEIEIDKRSNLFYLLERMQDEVHEFTINYHKQLRSKGSLESILESVEGIGNKRKIELLKKYKTITKMKEASLEELCLILPLNVANNLKDFLSNY